MTNDDTLRAALTKLADEWAASSCSGLVEELRALLAAHPAPETVAEMLAREATDAETMPVAEGPYVRNRPAPVSDTRREEEWVQFAGRAALDSLREFGDHPTISYRESGMIRAVVRAVLTALPAPVSDTRREDDALVETAARALYEVSPWVHDGVEIPWGDLTALGKDAFRDRARAVLAVLPAPPVVDEAEIGARALDEAADVLDSDHASSLWEMWDPIAQEHRTPVDWLRDRAARLRGATR